MLTEKGIPVCSYDRMGIGFSSDFMPEDTRSPLVINQQLHEALDVAGYGNKKLVYVGFSLGGGIAISYSRLYPDDVKALVLVDPA